MPKIAFMGSGVLSKEFVEAAASSSPLISPNPPETPEPTKIFNTPTYPMHKFSRAERRKIERQMKKKKRYESK